MQTRDPLRPGLNAYRPDSERGRGWPHPRRAEFRHRLLLAVAISAAVVLLGAQILFGVLAGFIGLLVATPLLVCLMVLIQKLYVEDTLGDPMPALGADA